DFVSVKDVAALCRLALERSDLSGEVINVGSGTSVTVNEIAQRLATILGKERIGPELTGEYRVGDIRHCFADIGKAKALLGFAPRVSLEAGMAELAGWLEGQVADDRVDEARRE